MHQKGVLFALVLILAFMSARAFVKVMERRVLFHPEYALEVNPALQGFEFRNAVIPSGGVNIHGWFIQADTPEWRRARFVIFYHGNAGNIADRMDFIRFLKPLGVNVLMIDYQGYGRSEGTPSIEGISEDGVAALEWLHLKRKVPLARITLWGRSLGAAAALAAAQRYPDVGGVIVESAFVSLRRISMDLFPLIPVGLVTDAFDNGSAVERIPTPKLFIHGVDDELIPFAHGEELYKRAAGPRQMVPVKSGHNDTYIRGGKEYLDVVGGWMEKL